MNKLRAEDLAFLDRAPKRWDFEEPVAAPPEAVFDAISADPSTWTWFPGLSRDAKYHGDAPHGVGSKREVSMAGTTYRETILAWDPPVRWAYRVDECSAPIARALVEDWVIAPEGAGSVVRWTFTIDPRALFTAGLPVAGKLMGSLFAKAMRNLSEQLQAARTR
jgi:uncharacterized protein YndB with AHSA1/START domain